MSFNFKTYEILKEEFHDAVLLLQGKHGSVEVEQLPAERRDQVLFIQKTIDALEVLYPQVAKASSDKGSTSGSLHDEGAGEDEFALNEQASDQGSSSEPPKEAKATSVKAQQKEQRDAEKKANILNGAIFVIREQIASKYQEKMFGSPDNSTFFRGLTKVLGITEDHAMTAEDRNRCVGALKQFIASNIFFNGNSENGLVADHAYLTLPIIQATWELIVDIKSQSNKEILTRSFEAARLARLEQARRLIEQEQEILRLAQEDKQLKALQATEASQSDTQKSTHGLLSSLWGIFGGPSGSHPSSASNTGSESAQTASPTAEEEEDVVEQSLLPAANSADQHAENAVQSVR